MKPRDPIEARFLREVGTPEALIGHVRQNDPSFSADFWETLAKSIRKGSQGPRSF